MKWLALAGGVGGAKLALGLSKILDPRDLTIVVNTGDDERFYGLRVSPDMGALSGMTDLPSDRAGCPSSFNPLRNIPDSGCHPSPCARVV